MAKYLYTAILTPDGDGYDVAFPDLPGCHTCGDDLNDALRMAQDVLGGYLTRMEDRGISINPPSPQSALKRGEDDVVTLVSIDTAIYRRLLSNRSVKKTLSIPEWMDETAKAKGINFSQVLQDALAKALS